MKTLQILGLLAVSSSVSLAQESEPRERLPNIVVIFIDDCVPRVWSTDTNG